MTSIHSTVVRATRAVVGSFILLTAIARVAAAQTTVGAPTPDSLARLFLSTFASGSSEAFDSLYPDVLGRTVIRTAALRNARRRAGLGRVLATSGDRAVLLLSGVVTAGSDAMGLTAGGEEMNGVRRLSGLYQAERKNGSWTLTRQIPIDTATYIRAQKLHVTLAPGRETRVVDSLDVDIGTSLGFPVRLTTVARISSAQLDGHRVDVVQGGGLIWIDAPRRAHSRLVLTYVVADDSPATPTDSVPSHGALNNTDGWIPFYGYDSSHDLASIDVTASIPAAYRLTTTFPQTESVRDGVRTVHGTSLHPQFLVALIYDRDWRVVSSTVGTIRLETFLTPAFRFSRDTLVTLVKRVYDVLSPRFGEPQRPSRYLAIVEHRALKGSGFTVRMNNAVVAGDNAIVLDEPRLGPTATFAHEVAHGWTMNATGPAANFLQEGWATFAESLILRDMYGPETERALWEKVRASYVGGQDRGGVARGFEGKQSILGDPDNGRIHYFKGSWLLRALETTLGDAAFDRAMREYIANQSRGPNGYEQFIQDMSHAAGHDMTAFIMPWLAEKYIPDVDARVEGAHLIVTQSQPTPPFDLPLDVALTTAAGTVRKSVHLTARADTVDVGDLGAISEVRVDPDHHFLLKRHWGETARFELRAPDAKSVELVGNFIGKPIAATRTGDSWVVELPLTEGRYVWQWRVDGKSPTDEETLAATKSMTSDPSARVGVRIVRAAMRLPDADAR